MTAEEKLKKCKVDCIFLTALIIGIPLGLWLGITFAPRLLVLLDPSIMRTILSIILVVGVLLLGILGGVGFFICLEGLWDEILKDKK